MSTPPPRPAPTPSSGLGALPWGLGLLVFLCVPFVSSVIAAVVMVIVGRSLRDKDEVTAENGRRAANWGLTYLLVTIVLITGHFVVLYLITRDDPIEGLHPLSYAITLWAVVTLVHVVLSLAGLVLGLRGSVLKAPAIPFFGHRTS
ncbi:DUF4870 domain-containing protein [Aeromicrobium sp. CTD01-1L150]|uniref:DUF4870 domain-containing protein n=1 Tax=Aeromicrobium sp. CTD01-1L150 TaxID=3341830 RepID=UPI0035C1D3A4